MRFNRRGEPHHDNEGTDNEPATSPVTTRGSMHDRLPAPRVYARPSRRQTGSMPFGESSIAPFHVYCSRFRIFFSRQ